MTDQTITDVPALVGELARVRAELAEARSTPPPGWAWMAAVDRLVEAVRPLVAADQPATLRPATRALIAARLAKLTEAQAPAAEVRKVSYRMPLAEGRCECGRPLAYNLSEGIIRHLDDAGEPVTVPSCPRPWPARAEAEPAEPTGHVLWGGPDWSIDHPADCDPTCPVAQLARQNEAVATIEALPDGRWAVSVNDLGDRLLLGDRLDIPAEG